MAGSMINKHVSSVTQGEEEEDNNSSRNTMVKVKLEGREEEDNNSSRNTMVKVKFEKQDAGLLVPCGFHKRKRLARSRPVGGKTKSIEEQRESSCLDLEVQKNKQPRLTTRWSTQRVKLAEQTMVEVLKENGASIEKPVSRCVLRSIARKKIGDTGLLDHLLKHVDGNVTPGGAERFRRCYNTDGKMQYWLESADLFKIKSESGSADPNWIPPPWWNVQSESSAVSKLLREEIDKMKSDIKKLASKQKLPDHADANEKVHKDLMSWRVQTDKQIVEISNSLTSTQCMLKELISWKDKVEEQLVGISNSLNNLQANGSTSLSPAPESWEQILQSANLDDFTGNCFEPWDVNANLIDVLPEAVRPDTYSLPPNPCWFEEQSLVNIEMQRAESCMTRGESRSSNQEKADMTPELDDPMNLSQEETLKELVSWKGKAEQQLSELSNAVLALQGQSESNWGYP